MITKAPDELFKNTVVNGILYVNKAGCQWRMLPKDFGRRNTVYVYFNRRSRTGTWKTPMERLRSQKRQRQGPAAQPSGGCVDSQSVKTATQGQAIGSDGRKHVKGRKRHLLVDTLGLLLAVAVTAANTGDRQELKELLSEYFAQRGAAFA